MNAFHDFNKYHVLGQPLPDVLGNKEYYAEFYYNSTSPTTQLSGTQLYQDVRKAQRQAGLPRNGIVLHQPRHEAALELRCTHNATRDEVACAADWMRTCMDTFYANMPAAGTVASLAGFADHENYMVFEALLDPADIPQFRPMWESIFPGVEDTLAKLVEVHPLASLPVVTAWCIFESFAWSMQIQIIRGHFYIFCVIN